MFTADMSDEQKREILLEMNLEQTEEAIKKGYITEKEVVRLLPEVFGLLSDDRQSAIEQLDRIVGEMPVEKDNDGNIHSMPGQTQGHFTIPDDVARKVMDDRVPPVDPIHAELVKLRKLGERQAKATEKVIDLLADILKELKRR